MVLGTSAKIVNILNSDLNIYHLSLCLIVTRFLLTFVVISELESRVKWSVGEVLDFLCICIFIFLMLRLLRDDRALVKRTESKAAVGLMMRCALSVIALNLHVRYYCTYLASTRYARPR